MNVANDDEKRPEEEDEVSEGGRHRCSSWTKSVFVLAKNFLAPSSFLRRLTARQILFTDDLHGPCRASRFEFDVVEQMTLHQSLRSTICVVMSYFEYASLSDVSPAFF